MLLEDYGVQALRLSNELKEFGNRFHEKISLSNGQCKDYNIYYEDGLIVKIGEYFCPIGDTDDVYWNYDHGRIDFKGGAWGFWKDMSRDGMMDIFVPFYDFARESNIIPFVYDTIANRKRREHCLDQEYENIKVLSDIMEDMDK